MNTEATPGALGSNDGLGVTARRAQVAGQCKAIAALCGQIAEVYTSKAQLFSAGRLDVLLAQVGSDSAKLMEYLGDRANGMDIVQAEDEWMDPIFAGAHAMFPGDA